MSSFLYNRFVVTEFWDIASNPERLCIDHIIDTNPELPDETWNLVDNLLYICRLRKLRNKKIKEEKKKRAI